MLLKKTKQKTKKSSFTVNNNYLHACDLVIKFIKSAGTDEGPHLWPKHLPFLSF